MKKMMIIAAMVGVMLIPAQMMAGNKMAKVEYNRKKEFNNRNDYRRFNDEKAFRKFDNKKDFYKMQTKKKAFNKKKKVYDKRKPYRPAMAVARKPAPRPRPIPRRHAPVKVIYERDPANAVVSAIGLAAIAAIIAN